MRPYGAIFPVVTLLASLHLGWLILAQADFFYPVCHDLLKIDQVVAEYGPSNQVRKNFHLTSRAERVRLFSAINRAVHRGGRGLGEIHYYGKDGTDLGALLTLWDQAHLSQVALLLSRLKILGFGWFALWGLMIFFAVKYHLPKPRLLSLILRTLVVLLGIIGAVFLIGPGCVFAGLHQLLFPASQPWFLYYQESLMTLLMKAPDLFGLIALQILGLGLVIWLVLLTGFVCLITFLATSAGTER